jgi:hypothetical protein
MANKDTDVQGAALYLELRRVGATCQIVITPDAYDSAGNVVWGRFFRRVLRPDAPKKRWQSYVLVPAALRRENLKDTLGNEHAEWEDISNERMRLVKDYFDSLVRGKYVLVNDTPLYVEITKADIDEVAADALSTKVWNRIKATRTAAGFPATIAD